MPDDPCTMSRRDKCSRCGLERVVVLIQVEGEHRIQCRSTRCGHVDVFTLHQGVL